jgi:hypothetical protein
MQGRLRQYAARGLAELGAVSEERRYRLGLVDRANYAFGLLAAAREASSLGYQGITTIEFGVGAGNGLLAMERHASAIGKLIGLRISVVGFDTGAGLPEPVDYRDLPQFWGSGFYPMDIQRLRERLSSAKLVLGDVKETVPGFLRENERELSDRPIGFVAFDLDLWSSTLAALDVFRGETSVCMPRVTCYFDDLAWTIEDVGELRAIRDFNQEAHGRRVRHPHMLRWMIPFQPLWAEGIFEAHLFDHPRYESLLAEIDSERVELHD